MNTTNRFMLPPTVAGLTPELLRASGCRSGRFTGPEFADFYGFRAESHPRFFDVMGDECVWIRPEFTRVLDAHFANVRRNWRAIGIPTA